MMKRAKLKDIATVEISGVDKKSKTGEALIHLCNFVDVYYNWAITSNLRDGFMEATANTNEIKRFTLKRGQVALTKDSETRDDIGIPTYIADDLDGVVLGYHNALVTPNSQVLNGKYLNALLNTDYAKKYFACNASGSGQRYALSVDALNDFPVIYPSLREQEQIGDIFSSIDQKIAINRTINHNLPKLDRSLIAGEVGYA
jgi:type I restriction enzyme S subunit